MVVGAPTEDEGALLDAGAGYLFAGSASGFAATPTLRLGSPVPEGGERCGYPIVGAGDVDGDGLADVLMSCRALDAGASNTGRVYLFAGSASGLTDRAARTLRPMSDVAGMEFGLGLSAGADYNGDHFADLAVGAHFGEAMMGAAMVFFGSPSGPPETPTLVLVDPNPQTNSEYGLTISTVGDIDGDGGEDLIVGAPDYDRAQENAGRAYLYLGAPGSIATMSMTTLDGDPQQQGARFGSGAAFAGDVDGDGYDDALVAARRQDVGLFPNRGVLYFYRGGPTGLADPVKIANPRMNAGQLGSGLAVVPTW